MVITSLTNTRVRHLREMMRKGQFDSENRVPVEGVKLVLEAILSHAAVAEVYVCATRVREPALQEVLEGARRLRIRTLFVADRVYNGLVDTESPQGIIALVKLPQFQLSQVVQNASLLLLAHQLQDPGNLGTLIRSAEAFGARAVLLTEKTVSAANQKAVRASAGSLFRIPVLNGLDPGKLFDELRRRRFRLIATTPKGGDSFDEVDYRGSVALVVGNEGSGLSKNILDQIDIKVTIPLAANVESLNVAVASSIILSEAARQRR